MSTKLLGAAIVAAALVMPCFALAQGNYDRFMSADSNRDGALTRGEVEQGRAALFNRADSNRDGSISQAEREAVRGQLQTSSGGGARLDADGNGAITRAEFMDRPYPAFERFDADHNDVLDANEIATIRARAAEVLEYQ